uniref:NADH-ubiquinone oxidoreductase chain 4L n=1 Tax=Carios vespertilionis TaxID=870211 RepID=A0A8B0R740_9ACAR|nr:NADH dehydrogenase subunit 4L [Carios vespertilionis]QTW91420.1 NADH dehydrogenase subunit 4L [Carios vespertilionis]QTW91433.1 NADH dehydrogenase subunit 4L [Carios vespertilionis]
MLCMTGWFMYMVGLSNLLMNYQHFLLVLMCLEFMYLGVLLNLIILLGFNGNFVNVVLFMIMVVCEAGLGLSILVLSVYYSGNDSINTISVLKC